MGKNNDSFEIDFELSDRGINSKFNSILSINRQKLSSLKVTSDKINTFQLLELWPKNFQMSVYEWMLKNSSGNINDFILDLEFSIYNNLNLNLLKETLNFLIPKLDIWKICLLLKIYTEKQIFY